MSESVKGICEGKRCGRFSERGYTFKVVDVTPADGAPHARGLLGKKTRTGFCCSVACMATVEK